MLFGKKWLALLLCAVMLAMPLMGVQAEEDAALPTIESALAAGKDVTYKANITWHENALLSAEENQMLKSMLDALEISGRYGKISVDDSYASFLLQLSGQEAFALDTVTENGDFYLVSELVGKPMAIGEDELEAYFRRLGEYMDKMAETQGEANSVSYADTFQQMFTQISTVMPASGVEVDFAEWDGEAFTTEDLVEAYDSIGLGGMVPIIQEWVETVIAQGEVYEGEILTRFGVETEKAIVYPLTKENLITLVEEMQPVIVENEEYWNFILSMMESSIPEGEEITAEDLIEQLRPEYDAFLESMQEMPENLTMQYNHCMNDKDEFVLGQIEFINPGDEDGYGELVAFAEWVPEGMPFYMTMVDNYGEGFELEILPNAETADGLKDDGFSAVFSMLDEDEVVGQMYMLTSSVKTEEKNGTIWDASLQIGMVEEYSGDMGVRIALNQAEAYKGDDIARETTVDVSLISGDAELQLCTINVLVETKDAAGAPFAIQDVEFVYPAQMSDEEFEVYLNEVSVSAMQALLKVMSLLPQDVFTTVMGG